MLINTPSPTSAPTGWASVNPTAVPSALGSGPLKGGWDIVRGRTEPAEGQRLSEVQRATLAPFLATRYGVPRQAAADALAAVRMYIGGPITGNGFAAMVLGNNIYLRDAGVLGRINAWEGRRLLAHELGHVMQRLQISDGMSKAFGGGDLGRTRAQLARYVAGMVIDPNLGGGAVPKGMYKWLAQRIGNKDTQSKLGNLVHDSHRLEIQAEQIGKEFFRSTS